MSKSEGVQFWAHQFYEHFAFIEEIIAREQLNTKKALNKEVSDLKEKWANADVEDDFFDLIRQTERTKDELSEQLRGCYKDLMLHMLGELEYFEWAILNEDWTLSEEMSYWAEEHSENLDFNNCSLPHLIQEDSLVAKVIGHPEVVDRMIEENRELSAQFKELSNQWKNSNQFDQDAMYQQFVALKAKHLNGLTAAIHSVKDLPLAKSTASMLYDMLKHESAEAEFAYQRLEHKMGY